MRGSWYIIEAGVLALTLGACAHGPVTSAENTAVISVRKDLARQMLERREWRAVSRLLAPSGARSGEDPELPLLRGIALREQGLLPEAERELRRAVQLTPDAPAAWDALGILLDRLGEGSGARECHEKAVALAPQEARWLNNLAFSWLVAGEEAKAAALFEEALRFEPAERRFQNNFGFVLARMGDFARAEQQFLRGGTLAEAANNLGYAYALAGRTGEARAQYDRALRLEPGLAVARVNRERLMKAEAER